MAEPIRVIAIGAHPDDCEYRMGATAALLAQAGHAVKFVSVTNGDAGHHKIKGPELAARRYAETLSRHFVTRDRVPDMLTELRRFYRLGLDGKLGHIARHA